jgi:hypothetical protein
VASVGQRALRVELLGELIAAVARDLHAADRVPIAQAEALLIDVCIAEGQTDAQQRILVGRLTSSADAKSHFTVSHSAGTIWFPHGAASRQSKITFGLRDYGQLPHGWDSVFKQFKRWERQFALPRMNSAHSSITGEVINC